MSGSEDYRGEYGIPWSPESEAPPPLERPCEPRDWPGGLEETPRERAKTLSQEVSRLKARIVELEQQNTQLRARVGKLDESVLYLQKTAGLL